MARWPPSARSRCAFLPGVEDGTSLRVSGESEHAYLIVRVKPGPKDSRLAQVAALTLLLCAVALLVYFLVWV